MQVVCIAVIFLLSYLVVRPLFVRGFFPVHDDTQPSRVYEMAKALKEGQFPVRMVQDLGYGYGYPIFNFYAPLPYYVGAAFNILGMDAISATKTMYAVGILLALVSMYFLGREIAGNMAGIVSAVIFTYVPYHAVDIYVRGAVGEYYALAFLPLFFLGLFLIQKSENKKENKRGKDKSLGLLLASDGLAGILLSHNILGMVTLYFISCGLLFLFIYSLIKKRGFSLLFSLILTVALGVGLSAFFTIPAVIEKGYTRVESLTMGGSNYSSNFVYPDQLWNSPWGYGGSSPGRADGLSFKIGKYNLFLGLLSVAVLFFLYFRKKLSEGIFRFILLIFAIFPISVYFMLEESSLFWRILPGFSFIQYPWRFLTFAVFSLSAVSAVVFLPLKRKFAMPLAIILVIPAVFLNYKYFQPKEYVQFQQSYYTSSDNLRFKISKISDEYLPPGIFIPKRQSEVVYHNLISGSNLNILSILAESATQKKYSIYVSQKGSFTSQIAYFPGWQAKIDGKNEVISVKNGLIDVFVSSGNHILEFNFGNTLVRTLSNAISILSLILLVYVSLFRDTKLRWPIRKNQ